MAEQIMFIGIPNADNYLNDNGMEFRKNKTLSDIHEAFRKGLKDGMGKTEFELGMIEVHLTKVLKLKGN